MYLRRFLSLLLVITLLSATFPGIAHAATYAPATLGLQ